MNTYIPSLIRCRLRLSSSQNQPPTLTKAAIAVREIVRSTAQKQGWCHSPAGIRAARAALHPWEEPCISGSARKRYHLFFRLHAALLFLPELPDQQRSLWKDISGTRLEEIFLELQAQGAHNINLVTPTRYLPSATARLKTGQTAAFHPDRLQLRRL